MSESQKYTWIIGASAGIGAALAQSLSENGEALCLSARSSEGLLKVQKTLSGDEHMVLPFDASDRDAVFEAHQKLREQWPRIDRVIFMAGLYTPTNFGNIDLNEAEKIISVNLTSVFYLVETILPMMTEQSQQSKKGQIAICTSVAGYVGLPNSQPYGASKAGLINLVESLKAEVGQKLDIKMINPGFVETRLTEKNNFDMPARISAEEAGKIIARGLDGRGFEIHFPKRFTFVMKFISNLPYWLYFRAANKMR